MSFSPFKPLVLSTALACLTVPGVALAAKAPPPVGQSDARTQLQASYTKLEAAMESRSPTRIKAMLAPGFRSTLLSGKSIDADAMIAQLQRVPTDPNRETKTTIDNLTVSGNQAHVQQTMTATAKVKGKSGAAHVMKLIAAADDTWEHTPEGWRLKTTTSKDMTVTQDGKIVRHAHIGDAALNEDAGPARKAIAGPQMKGR